ncbi:MAG TPA: hypothetical protein VFT75_15670 [Nocardioidaceae bacterium]|jgi:hypothetical protein|nr:hypothetical protein [Nocardioidaceae bacterium]
MDDEHIPPLLSVDQMPAVRCQDDLHRHWRALMGPLGFSGRQLWLNILGGDRRPTPMLLQIDEVPVVPEPPLLDGLMAVIEQVLEDAPDGSAAVLLARPGSAPMTLADRGFAQALVAAARRSGVPLEPVHLATDLEVRAFAPDDLAA